MKKNNKLLKHLYSLQAGKIKAGLENIKELLNSLNNPQTKYPIIHVAGTNGKGSVSSLIASILKESGYKVGLYTSPHIFALNERMTINGIKISDKEIEKNYSIIEAKSKEINASFFDITTAIAFNHFSNSLVDIAVVEAGLGGKFDSTNVVEPILSVITTIAQDHCDILGETVEEIAKEKAGIIKNKTTVIALEQQNSKIVEILQNKAKELTAELLIVNEYPMVELIGYSGNQKMILSVSLIDNMSFSVATNLIGPHQIDNIRIAVFATLLFHNKFEINYKSISRGIENVSENTGLRYRIEFVSQEPEIIFDVAHNPDSLKKLIGTLEEVSFVKRWNFIFGAMADKNIEEMLELIKPFCEKLIVVAPEVARAASTETIVKIAQSLEFRSVQSKPSIQEAMHCVKSENFPTVVCGSFFVIEEAAIAMGIA